MRDGLSRCDEGARGVTDDTARAVVLLSRAGRPWARDRVSYVSDAVGRLTGCRLSHASLDVAGTTYTFMTPSGVVVRPRVAFERRAYELFEVGECTVDMGLMMSMIRNRRCKYDWAAIFSGIGYIYRERPLPVAPLRELHYTCASFVAHVCNVPAPGTSIVNRYTTARDILRHFGFPQDDERFAEPSSRRIPRSLTVR